MMVVLALSAGIMLHPPPAPGANDGVAVRALAATRAAAVAISRSDSGGGSAAAAPRQLLFTQGTPPPANPVTAQPAAPPPAEMPGLQLYGVVIVEPGSRLAFIQDGSRRGQLRKVREGQTVAGALVKAIYPDRVILVSTGGEVSLMLRAKKDGLPTGLASSVDVPASPVDPSGSTAARAGEADDRSPQPLNSSDLSIPLITRQPLYPQ